MMFTKMLSYLLLFILIVFFNSCQSVESPTGFVGAKDVAPPRLTILSPSNNQKFKDFLEVHFSASDFSGISRIEFNINGYNSFGTLTQNGNDYAYKIDIAFENRVDTLSITVYDNFGNSTSKKLIYIAQPIIRRIVFPGVSNIGFYTYKGIMDKKGVIWFTTFNGLVKISDSTCILNPAGFSLSTKQLNSIAVDGSNNIWIDYREMYSSSFQKLAVFNGTSTASILNFPDLDQGSITFFRCFAFDSHDTLWGCWSKGIFKYKEGDFTYKYSYYYLGSNINFNDIAIDHEDNKWFATNSGVKRFDGTTWVSFDNSNTILQGSNVSKIKVDVKDRVWVIVNGILAKYAGNQWTVYDNFKEGIVTAFCLDNDNYLWLGIGGYVFKFDGQKVLRKIQIETPAEMITDSHNNIWIGTDYGIYELNDNGL